MFGQEAPKAQKQGAEAVGVGVGSYDVRAIVRIGREIMILRDWLSKKISGVACGDGHTEPIGASYTTDQD